MNKRRKNFIDHTGERWKTNEGYWITIIKCLGETKCTIQFEDGNILENVRYEHIKKGNIKNLWHRSVHGVGYLGGRKYKTKENHKHTKAYSVWHNILTRCYYKKVEHKHPTYVVVTVDECWHNFQNFAEWFYDIWQDYMDSSWQLDKDILKKGNKTYSPETCCLVPQELNNVLTKNNSNRGEYPIGVSLIKYSGKFIAQINIEGDPKGLDKFDTPEKAFYCYKLHKENRIKELANKWRGKITEQCYWALINYKVEITD